MKRSFFYTFFLLFLIACNGNNGVSGKKIFRYNSSSGITSLDPAFARDQANIWAVQMLYSGLVQFDRSLNIQPCIAKRWLISDDGLTYTFHLRNDVFFTDHELFENGKGRKLNAADVAYSLGRIIDPKTASPGSWIFNGRVDTVAPFTAMDDTTFQLKLRTPFRPMLSILTMQYTYIVPKEAAEHYGKDFRVNPVGTGPFKLKVLQDGNRMILVKNEKYFETDGTQQLPYLDGVKVSFIQSKQTEYLQFMKGELDFLSGIDATYVNDLLTKEGALKPEHHAAITMHKMPYLNSEYLGFLMQDNPVSPLNKKEVRQAINYGFDRQLVVKYLRNNIGKPATSGFVPYGLPSFDAEKVKGYDYNPEKAKHLLEQAGYPQGKGLPEIPLYTSKTYEDIATYIQKQLREIGIPVKIEIVLPAFQRELMSKSQAPFFRGSWIADYPDAESYLAMFYSGHGAPPNYTRFGKAAFDNLYEKALNENNDSVRYELYRQMDQLVIDEAVVAPLFYDEVVRFVKKGVTALEPNPMNLLDLKNVRIE